MHDPSFELGSFFLNSFPNGERQVVLNTCVKEKVCYIFGSVSTSHELFDLLALAHTLKKEKARQVIAYIPYLAYTRQERFEAHKSRLAALVGQLLKASSVDQVVTVDVHSPLVQRLFPLPLTSLSSAPLFAHALKQIGWNDCTFVAPDKGAIKRCQEVSTLFGILDTISWMEKRRHEQGVSHFQLHGPLKERVVIIDDMVDTGETLLSCCKELKKHNVKEICVMVTHGLFTGTKWQKLIRYGVSSLYCTDSLSIRKEVFETVPLVVLPLAHIMQEVYYGKIRSD